MTSSLHGIALKIASTLLFGAMSAMIKLIGARYPIGEIVFCRATFALVPVMFLAWQGAGIAELRTARPMAHLSRSISGSVSMMCNFTALTLLPLADATVLSFLAAMLTTALAALTLGERVGPYRWSAVIVGFGGVVIASLSHLNPQARGLIDLVSPGVAFALAGASLTAFAMISIRRLSSTESSLSIVFYFMLVCVIGSGATLFFEYRTPSPTDAVLLVAIGLTGGMGQVLMTSSYRHASASTLAPFDYVAIIWATIFGFLLFDQIPESSVLTGAAIVILAGLFIVYREHRLGLLARRQAQDATAA